VTGAARAARRTAVAVLAVAAAGAGAPAWAAATPPVLAQHDSATGSQGGTACLKASTTPATAQTPWALQYLDPESVWSLTEGANVTVAVLGSGVDDSSGMLAGRLTLGPQEAPGGASTGSDCVGQGTFCAGLIAARGAAGSGFAGIAPAARILAIGVTDSTGGTDADVLAAGIRAAAAAHARIIDVTVPASATDAALDSAVADAIGSGSLIVAPYLDDAQDTDAQSYPAALPGVLSVADLGPGGLVPTASRAPSTGSAAAAVGLAAPGDDVLGPGPGGSGMFVAAGPSYAAALVAGTAALVLGYRPQLTEAQLFARLEATAYHPGSEMPDAQVGYGTVDPVDAVTEELPQESAAGGRGAAPPHRTAPGSSLVMPPPTVSNAPRESAAVAGGSAAVILLAGLGAGIGSVRRRRAAHSPEGT
jgi:membrane-anchored mycosin MYCP